MGTRTCACYLEDPTHHPRGCASNIYVPRSLSRGEGCQHRGSGGGVVPGMDSFLWQECRGGDLVSAHTKRVWGGAESGRLAWGSHARLAHPAPCCRGLSPHSGSLPTHTISLAAILAWAFSDFKCAHASLGTCQNADSDSLALGVGPGRSVFLLRLQTTQQISKIRSPSRNKEENYLKESCRNPCTKQITLPHFHQSNQPRFFN